MYDVVDPCRRHVKIACEAVLAHAEGRHELFQQNLSRCNQTKFLHHNRCSVSSVGVDDLHAKHITIFPLETNPPLIVDSDAVLTASLAAQRLQPISRRNPEVYERFCIIKHKHSSTGDPFNCAEPWDSFVSEQTLSILAAKAPNHVSRLSRLAYSVNRNGHFGTRMGRSRFLA